MEQPPATTAPQAPAANKWLIAIAVMLATILEVLDMTIANVALDHIRGSLSAGVDEAAWVMTSYIVGNAIVILKKLSRCPTVSYFRKEGGLTR